VHDAISAQLRGRVGVVELVGPEPNYVDAGIVEALVEAMAELDADSRCRAVVLGSAGRHFCAGANFGEGGIGSDRPAEARRLYGAAARLFDLRVPIIAAVQGAAVGAGMGLACAADFRVAASSSRFHANFTRLGFHPGFGLTATLPQIVGRQRAIDLFYSGRRIDGTEAFAIGLVDRLVDESELPAAAVAWADDFAHSAPLAVRSVKATMRGQLGAQVRTALEHEVSEQTWLWATDDCREGIEAAAARRQPHFEGR
jgi:2-(1,2-epoxy-1,2-dihydrophenyl)acetyl-CoA isomerase